MVILTFVSEFLILFYIKKFMIEISRSFFTNVMSVVLAFFKSERLLHLLCLPKCQCAKDLHLQINSAPLIYNSIYDTV